MIIIQLVGSSFQLCPFLFASSFLFALSLITYIGSDLKTEKDLVLREFVFHAKLQQNPISKYESKRDFFK